MGSLKSTKAVRQSVGSSARRRTGQRADRLIRGLRKALSDQAVETAGTSEPRTYGYGLAEVETTRVFREIKEGGDGRLHLVDVIAADQIDGVLAYLLIDTTDSGSQAVIFPGPFPGQQGASGSQEGEITSGRFKNNGSQIILRDGAPGQTSVADLVNRTSVDSSFVGTGIAYIYSRWTFIEGRFDGDPEIRAIARLRKCVDPRGGVQRWSFNPYVHTYDFLTKSRDIGGAGIDADLIDTATFASGADWADMLLSTPAITKTALLTTGSNTAASNHLLEFNETVTPFQYGDVVNVVAGPGQVMPASFSPGVDYHVIPIRHRFGDFQVPAIALAATLEDALDGIFIAAGARTTPINIKKVKETRYMSGFTYRSNEAPLSVVEDMLESCGSSIYLNDGKIAVTTQQFPDTIIPVTDNEVRGSSIEISNRRVAQDDRATSLTGGYTSMLNLFEPKDYPVRDGAGAFKAADGGKGSPKRLDLLKVGKSGVAQRLATIKLRRLRQERTLKFSGTLSLYRLKPGTVFSMDHAPLGLDANTTWEVRDQTIFVDTSDGTPAIRIDIEGRQLESNTFDLDATGEDLVEAAVIPGLESPFEVAKPGTPVITEDLFFTTRGAGVKAIATVSWTEAVGGFVSTYRPSYKLATESAYRPLPPGPELSVQIPDIEPGLYDFRVVAVNTRNLESEPSDKQQEIFALSAPPEDPVKLEGQQSNIFVILSWDQSTDLDVQFGGKVEVRHQSDVAGGKGGSSRLLATIDGNLSTITTSFVKGTYYIRFIDQQGNASGFAEWSTDEVRPVPFGQTITSGAFVANDGDTENQVTLSESPTFPSTNGLNTMIEDTGNQWVTLPTVGGIDDEPNVDLIANIDDIVTGNSVAEEGVWFFDQDIELTAEARVLWEAEIETEIVDIASGIDSIDNVDGVPNIDAVGAGTAQAGQATAWIEIRYSRGTVASDTFGPWERLESRILFHRSFQFRVQARSFLPSVNIRVKTARVFAREKSFDS